MAKPVEVAFTLIRNHKAFRHLKILERGIFFILAQACILDEIEFKRADMRRIAVIQGCTSQQWVKGGKKAVDALEVLYPVLWDRYLKDIQTRDNLSNNAKRAFQKTWDMHHEKRLEAAKEEHSGKNFSDSVNTPVILQPQKKLQPFRPQTIDNQQRNEIIATRKKLQVTDNAFLLADKNQ